MQIHELESLTNQLTYNKVDLCRWDESAACLLPEYSKNFYLKIISNFREFDNELGPHEKYRSAYNKKAVGQCYLISIYYGSSNLTNIAYAIWM